METNTPKQEFSDVLCDELARLRPESGNPPYPKLEACADQAQLVGLALSGGGVRSATFALGVTQALAKLRLLRGFDYLSTVSGGGYIGSWLSTLIYRSRKPGQSQEEVLEAVERELSGEARPWCEDGTPASDCPAEHPSLRFLRRYSNYLTPRLGLLSGDSLAAVSTYLRNLLLNQLILVAFFGALLTLPYLLLNVGRWLVGPEGLMLGSATIPLLFGLAIVLLLVAVGACRLSLARYHKDEHLNATSLKFILRLIVVPSVISAWFSALTLYGHKAAAQYSLLDWVTWTMLGYLLPWLLVVALWLKSSWTNVQKSLVALKSTRDDPHRQRAALDELIEWRSALARFGWHFLWTLPPGALGGVFFYTLGKWAQSLPETGGLAYATAFGTPMVLMSFSLVVTLHIGLMRRLNTEQDREWWARLGGLLILAALVWLSAFAVTLYSAPLVKWLAGLAVAGGLAWVATSIGGVILGKSSLTVGQTQSGKGQVGMGKSALNMVAVAAPYVFIIGLTILLASLLHAVLTRPILPCEECLPIVSTGHFGAVLNSSLFNLARVDVIHVLMVGTGCVAVFLLLGWRVDINLFSLHGFYSNRLTRCYLGATRIGQTKPVQIVRKPHPFTGFDPGDDLPLSVLVKQRPYPIINAAMNLTGGENLAWQTRRAASFTFTPGHTGFEFWDSVGDRSSAYRSTEEYAAKQFSTLSVPGGISLGTVVGTSGAAANPNMGYHTSPPLSALLSVFNVRLGRWCGNPQHDDSWSKASPNFGGMCLINEVFGNMTSHSKFLNVSDGGHFENLGIYELVRRRCRIVVAVDAGCDPDYQFEDLANAIRKCWTDFGTRIEIDLSAMRPKLDPKNNAENAPKRSEMHFAVGEIHYPNAPKPGTLIYIKASLSGDESSDVQEYADRHPGFPNESTGDQFFNENQFESYRELGRHIGLKVFAPLFSPKTPNAAETMTPEEIRDALALRLPEHPALQTKTACA